MSMPFKDFEPGSVVCEDCKSRPNDPWDNSPDGFCWFPQWYEWICDDCRIKVVKEAD